MTEYTFQIGGVDLSEYVNKYGYETDEVPVVAWSMTDLRGVDHEVITRWRGVLTVTLNTLPEAVAINIFAQLKSSPLEVTYTVLQTGEVVTKKMRAINMPLRYLLTTYKSDGNANWLSGATLRLEEL